MRRHRQSTFFIHVRDVMHVVHIHHKPPHFLRDFGLGFFHILHHLAHEKEKFPNVPGGGFDVGAVFVAHFRFFFMALLSSFPPLSAWLNSFPTLRGTPPYPPLVCAAAAIRRACAGDLLGIRTAT